MAKLERTILLLLGLVFAPVLFLIAFPLMLYVRFAKPKRGVTIGLVVSNRWTDFFQYTRICFDLALVRAGARVMTIAPKHHRNIAAVLEKVDGLLLTGGEDLHPSYHDADESLLSEVNEARDELEMEILAIADYKNIPYLCVCRGSQLMAVRAKGKIMIHPHVNKRVKPHVSRLFSFAKHEIDIAPGTRLAEILGEGKTVVNSFHHLLIDDAGTDTVSATAGDVIEGLEKPGGNFAVGVQWHPEFMAPFIRKQQKLFNDFVKIAGHERNPGEKSSHRGN